MERLLLVLADPVKLEKKLFSLVEEFGKLAGIEDLGWALLAKLVYGCDQGMLKAIASRIQVIFASPSSFLSVPCTRKN